MGVSPRPPQQRGVMPNAWSGRGGAILGVRLGAKARAQGDSDV